MYYPQFTKAIIHHFITKDKSISMRNILFMHTAENDNILGPMRFVSKADDYQVYGALLLKVMTNQKMRDSPAYKTYLALATGGNTRNPLLLQGREHLSPWKRKSLNMLRKLYLSRSHRENSIQVYKSETLLAQVKNAL
ncbi:hypothetical protein Tco_0486367 [Tanacetum coccineum]